MRIKLTKSSIIEEVSESIIIKESSKAEWSEVLLKELILTKHRTAKWIPKHLALSVNWTSIDLRSKACKEWRPVEKVVEKVRSSCASKRIESTLLMLMHLWTLLLLILLLSRYLLSSSLMLLFFLLTTPLHSFRSWLSVQVCS
jgi:hypothetical protein